MTHGRQPVARHRRWPVALVLGAGLGLGLLQEVAAQVAVGGPPSWLAPSPNSYRIVFGSGGTPLLMQGARTVVPGVSGGFVASETGSLAGRAGALAVNVARNITPRAAARAMALCLGSGPGLAACAVGAATIPYLWDRYGVSADGTGGLLGDPGQGAEASTQWCYGPGDTLANQCYLSASQGAQALASHLGPGTCSYQTPQGQWVGPLDRPLTVVVQQSTPSRYTFDLTYLNCANQGAGVPVRKGGGTLQGGVGAPVCPASIDPTNPAYSVPAGAQPMADGMCPTARYNHQPISVEQAAQRYVTALPGTSGAPTAQAAADALRDALQRGAPVEAPVSVTGPASQQGQPKTVVSTGPLGQTTTTTTNNYTYNYAGDTITYNTVTVTSVTHPDGTTTTTQEGETPSDQEDPTECEKNPDSVGCQELGEAPDDEVPRAERQVDYQAEAVNLPAGCPPDVQAGDYTLSYRHACEFALDIKPAVLAAAAFAAVLMVVMALRR